MRGWLTAGMTDISCGFVFPCLAPPNAGPPVAAGFVTGIDATWAEVYDQIGRADGRAG